MPTALRTTKGTNHEKQPPAFHRGLFLLYTSIKQIYTALRESVLDLSVVERLVVRAVLYTECRRNACRFTEIHRRVHDSVRGVRPVRSADAPTGGVEAEVF